MVQTEPVVVRFERSGRGGKSVTVLEGLRENPKRRDELLVLLKKKLGAGGTSRGGTLEIQGDQRGRLGILLTEWGYRVTRGN